jgi:hypothetical protein
MHNKPKMPRWNSELKASRCHAHLILRMRQKIARRNINAQAHYRAKYISEAFMTGRVILLNL